MKAITAESKTKQMTKKTYCHFVSIFFMTLTLKHIQKVKALETQEMFKSFFLVFQNFKVKILCANSRYIYPASLFLKWFLDVLQKNGKEKDFAATVNCMFLLWLFEQNRMLDVKNYVH